MRGDKSVSGFSGLARAFRGLRAWAFAVSGCDAATFKGSAAERATLCARFFLGTGWGSAGAGFGSETP